MEQKLLGPLKNQNGTRPFVRILIYGAGALGTLVGAHLAQCADVILLAREEHALACSVRTTISGVSEIELAIPSITDPRALDGKLDLVILTVKAHQTPDAVQVLSTMPSVHLETRFLSLQNGLNNEPELAGQLGPQRIIGGITTEGATWEGPGRVVHAGRGSTVLGPWSNARIDDIVDLFRQAGLSCEASEQIHTLLWRKAIVNAVINPITAITGLENGALLEVKALKELAREVATECQAVAEEAQIPVGEDILDAPFEVARHTSRNRSSMLQDVMRGRRTEIEAITGVIVNLADELGIQVPRNRVLLALVAGIEASTKLF